jgi:uncharacterized protein (UPF0248 family)
VIPIHDLLNRIRWDTEFAHGNFRLGYYDRVVDRVIQVDFDQIHFPPESHSLFELIDADGAVHSIPFHRVRDVYRDGKRIWHRESR